MMSLKEKMAAKKSAKEKKAVEREKKAAENVKIKQKALSPYLPECAVKPHPLGWGYQARTAKQS